MNFIRIPLILTAIVSAILLVSIIITPLNSDPKQIQSFWQNAIIGIATIIITIFVSFGASKIQTIAQKFREGSLDSKVRVELIELFHDSINLVYSKEISLIREVSHNYSSEEFPDDHYWKTIEPKQKFKSFDTKKSLGTPCDPPAIYLKKEYNALRKSLDEQRDKQYLFTAKIRNFSIGDDENTVEWYYEEFVKLRKKARYVTYLVRKIMESENDVELESRIALFYIQVYYDLSNSINTYSNYLSHEMKIHPICFGRIKNYN